MSRRSIVFVGDSYCSAWSRPSRIDPQPAQQGNQRESWIDHCTLALDLDFYSFGFAGKAWWYSRHYFLKYWREHLDFTADVDAFVFVHTDPYRFPSHDIAIGTEIMCFPEDAWSKVPEIFKRQKELSVALKYYYAHLHNDDFHFWAFQQWIMELDRILPDRPVLHFHTLPHSIPMHQLVYQGKGMLFTNSLTHISLGEYTGTEEEIHKKNFYRDQRPSHFNAHNNQAFGAFVTRSLINYEPGIHAIDLSDFDQPNPNAHLWPNTGYGTE